MRTGYSQSQRLERLNPENTHTTDLDVYEGELVGPAPAAPLRHRMTPHTVLGPGVLPPHPGELPAWTDADFELSAEDIADLSEPDLAENTIINRDSTVRAFTAWCAAQKPTRTPWPCTTETYTAYGLHLIRRGKAGEFKPDTVGQYMSRIYNWQPVDLRPDLSRFKGRLRVWKKAWTDAGGEVDRTAAVTIGYKLRIIAAIDETTAIGKWDASVHLPPAQEPWP
ncbi:hypothetical protein ABZ299_35075 [Streptomyces sp. NPDC006184]|uniref:hypothetical protein n=1 Tax=Streptomyces sp. NPDC006184 TaxID=3155455 RepID=UPI0033A09DBC